MPETFAAYGKPMQPVAGPALWDRAQITADPAWRYQLAAETLAEIRANISHMDAEQVVLKDVTAENFPLASFAGLGAEIRRQLGFGRGIANLGGLDVGNYTLSELKLIYSGLCAHIGITVSQSHRGDYIGEVMDFRDASDDRRYHNGGEFVMHRDPTADVTGLLSIRRSREGGYSRLMSAALVHNVLLAERPELMETFYRGFYFRRTTPDRGTTALYTANRIPSFDFAETGEFMAHYIPHFSEYYIERDGLPADHVEVRAQAAIKEVLWERPELYLEYMMEPGDMQFVSNRIALHSRTAYVDWPEIERARLLVRVWMQLPGLPPVPPHMQYFENRDRADGGIAKLEPAAALP